MQELLDELIQLQIKLNNEIDPNWKKNSEGIATALWVESGELMNHHGEWKWWKKTKVDLKQVKLELVDILHFGISLNLTIGKDTLDYVECYYTRPLEVAPGTRVARLVEDMVVEALTFNHFHLEFYLAILAELEISFEEIYKLFWGKHLLNAFRQRNGYSTGEYNKEWLIGGKLLEDNEILFNILEETDLEGPQLVDHVNNQLQTLYSEA